MNEGLLEIIDTLYKNETIVNLDIGGNGFTTKGFK
jgi:hypothetical protein